MVKMAYRTEDGKIAILNTNTDKCLYSGRWIAGREQSRFSELYYHKTKNGRIIFYIAYRTYWQGETDSIEVLADDEVEDWLVEHYSRLYAEEIAEFKELGYAIEEDA